MTKGEKKGFVVPAVMSRWDWACFAQRRHRVADVLWQFITVRSVAMWQSRFLFFSGFVAQVSPSDRHEASQQNFFIFCKMMMLCNKMEKKMMTRPACFLFFSEECMAVQYSWDYLVEVHRKNVSVFAVLIQLIQSLFSTQIRWKSLKLCNDKTFENGSGVYSSCFFSLSRQKWKYKKKKIFFTKDLFRELQK